MTDDFIVNGLPLPPLLISLMQAGKWRYPGPVLMQAIVPDTVGRVDLPIEFFSLEAMRSETESQLRYYRDDDDDIRLFREKAAALGLDDNVLHLHLGSTSTTSIELPSLDAEKSFFIAGSAVIGDDILIALDYRTSTYDPRVVITAWGIRDGRWVEVTPTFTEFARRLGLI